MKDKIQHLAPLLSDHFIDAELNELSDRDHGPLSDEYVNILGSYHKYLGKLHDSWITECNILPTSFYLRLNDFATYVFADALVAKKGLTIKEEELIFSIDLDFRSSQITFNTVDDDGSVNMTEPVEVSEYLDEQIISADNNTITLGIVAWSTNELGKHGMPILILISAEKVSLKEHQDQDWNMIFGNNYDHYYHYFKTERSKGRYVSDLTICKELIDEVDQAVNNV